MKRGLLWTILLGLPAAGLALLFTNPPWKSAIADNGVHYYAAVQGTAKAKGTINDPWDIKTALSHPPAVHPGDTIFLRAGTYSTGDATYFYSKLTGAEDRFITVRPYGHEHVVIDGGIEVDNPWVIFRDLEITNSDSDRISTQPTSFPTDVTQLVGFNVFAPNVKIINNLIHDNSAGVDAWAQAADDEIYGNLIFYNGWRSGTHAHGHGMYMQNSTGNKYVLDNIIFDQFGQGMQFYGSNAADLNNFHVEGNIVFNNGALNGEHSRNILLGGGRVAQNPVITSNYMYFPPRMTLGGDHNIGYYPFGTGCSNLKFTDNYIASDGPALNLFKCTVSSIKGNTFIGELNGWKASDYPKNEFYSRNSLPKGVKTFVRKNRYEPGRANIVVFNWDHADSVTIDGSDADLDKGDAYELHNAQDYAGDVTTGIFDGDAIKIRMNRHTVAHPVGVDAPPTTFPEFGAFVIRKAAPANATNAPAGGQASGK
jgi:hypothetical protein